MALLSSRIRQARSVDRAQTPYGMVPKENNAMVIMTRSGQIVGSQMPLDIEPHWSWRNPLNVIPATLLVLGVAALIGTVV